MGKALATTALCSTFLVAASTITAMAADANSKDDMVMEEVVTLGSRSAKPRSATDSPVPVDVINGNQFSQGGNTVDITDNLKALIPSYTATPATGDGSAFIRPTSLRGMAPDQTLILVNGKRRHRSALVQFFAPAAGNGAQGVDVGMIPSIALKRVEVLRDGAAAQYGSDAIAGVINFEMKDASEGGEVQAQYGQFYRGEVSYKIAANAGMALGDNGFANLSAEYVNNDALSRGIQRPDAQALIDAGLQGVGADSPFGDAPLAQTWGRPQTRGLRTFLNAGVDLNDSSQLYFFGSYAKTDGRYRFFYRNPNHSTIQKLSLLPGFTGLPVGYTPFLDGNQTDFSAVGGVKGEFDVGEGMAYDFSVGYGKNQLKYFLNNTTNPSLGLNGSGQPLQRDFRVGGYDQKEINLDADFSIPLNDSLNLAFGGVWRQETYVVHAGEPNSYTGDGSNGLNGFRPADAGSFNQSNYAVYVDIEHDITDKFMLQYAGRFEHFNTFGGTINGKLAGRYTVSDAVTLRGAISTGFHAPTPGQQNVKTTITTFDGSTGLQVEEGLIKSTDPDAITNGGAPLREETAVNYSAGFTSNLGEDTTFTVDYYRIDVKHRIYRTGNIPVFRPNPVTGVLEQVAGASISFYTNALDTRSQGVDVVLTTHQEWSENASTDVSFALSYNDFKVTGQTPVVTPLGPKNPVSAATIEDIENNYPSTRFVLTTNTFVGDNWSIMARANFYGKHYDERGRIGAAVNPSAQIKATVYFDLEVAYQFTENFKLVAGGSNIFDSFVNKIGPPNANRLSVGLQYPRRSAANYEGGSWYARGVFTF